LSDIITFGRHGFTVDANSRQDLLEVAFFAHLAILNGSEPGDLRWLDPSWDFVWRDARGNDVPMDAFDILALFRTIHIQKRLAMITDS
jgi:hypothetical protein